MQSSGQTTPTFQSTRVAISGAASADGVLKLEAVVRFPDGRRQLDRIDVPYASGRPGASLIEQLRGTAAGLVALLDRNGELLVSAGSDAFLDGVRVVQGGTAFELAGQSVHQDGLTISGSVESSQMAVAISHAVGIYGNSRLDDGWIDIEFEVPGRAGTQTLRLQGSKRATAEEFLGLLLQKSRDAGLSASREYDTIRYPNAKPVAVGASDAAHGPMSIGSGRSVLANNTALTRKYYVEVWFVRAGI
jgi:hypothetical protein